MRKQVWKAVGGAGVVLVDGEATALWRARKQGKRLEVTVDGKAPRRALQAEAERLAPHRGCTSVGVRWRMIGPTDVVQPWMPRAARDSDASLCHVSIVGGAAGRSPR